MNWLRFASDREPVPEWPLEAILDGAAAAGFRAVGLDRHTVARHADAGGSVEGLGEELRARGLGCTDVGVLPLGTPGVLDAAEQLARLASATGAHICIAAHYAPTSFEAAARELGAGAEILAAAGVTLVLEFVAYGCERAETLGLDPERVINTWPADRLLSWCTKG